MLTLGPSCRYFFVALLHDICQSVHLPIMDQTIKGTHVPIKADSSLTHVHSSAYQASADWWYWGQCIGWKSEDRKKDRSKWNTPFLHLVATLFASYIYTLFLWFILLENCPDCLAALFISPHIHTHKWIVIRHTLLLTITNELFYFFKTTARWRRNNKIITKNN